MPKSNVTVFMDEALLGRVRADAEADGRSISNFVEQLLKKHYPVPGESTYARIVAETADAIAKDRGLAGSKPQRKSLAKRK